MQPPPSGSRGTVRFAALALSVVLALIGAIAAGRYWERVSHEAEEHAADHKPDDEPTVAITQWDETLEVFLERPFAVAGESMPMLVHVSLVESGQPLRTASMRLTARADGQPTIEITRKRPGRPGIYLPDVALPQAGQYRVTLAFVGEELPGGRASIELPSIEVFADHDATMLAAAGEDVEAADAITFLKEQQWRIGLLSTPAARQDLIERLIAPGKVVVPPGSAAVVTPPISGKLYPPDGQRFVEVGQTVSQGQPLGWIEPSVAGSEGSQLVTTLAQLRALDAELAVSQLEAESKVKTAELEHQLAEQHFSRLETVTEQGAAAGKRLLDARFDLDRAEALFAAAKGRVEPYREARTRIAEMLSRVHSGEELTAQRGANRVLLVSPLSGTVVESRATSGEFVHTEDTLFRVVDLSRLWIEANVSEYDLARIEPNPAATFRLPAYPGRTFSILPSEGGRLVDVGALVDTESRTVPIRYEVPNREGALRVGMFAELLVETDRRENSLSIPREAIVEEGGLPVVYVQLEGESFARRPVELGIRDVENVEVRAGIEPGERVVTRGAYAIRLSALSSTAPAHHHH